MYRTATGFMIIKDDLFIFTSAGLIGISHYHYLCPLLYAVNEDMSQSNKIELAEFMISEWQRLKDSLTTNTAYHLPLSNTERIFN